MSTSLTTALLPVLRANSGLVSAFGDAYDPTTGEGSKFFTDWANLPDEPYLVIEELGEQYDYDTSSGNPTVHTFRADNGTLRVSIVQTGREAAQALATLVCNVLNDCDTTAKGGPVTWTDFNGTSTLLMLRMASAHFVPDPGIGPDQPTTFTRVVMFSYEYQGYI